MLIAFYLNLGKFGSFLAPMTSQKGTNFRNFDFLTYSMLLKCRILNYKQLQTVTYLLMSYIYNHIFVLFQIFAHRPKLHDPCQVKENVFPTRRKVGFFLGGGGVQDLVGCFYRRMQLLFRFFRCLAVLTGLYSFNELLIFF